MAEPTEADRARARELALLVRSGVGGPRLREEAIAQALADERERARAPFERLFSGGPNTACRTTWIPDPSMPDCSAASIECVEVPMADLRAAFEEAP